MASVDQFIASLEEEFGEQGKGKPFDLFCKWFLENDPEWSALLDKVLTKDRLAGRRHGLFQQGEVINPDNEAVMYRENGKAMISPIWLFPSTHLCTRIPNKIYPTSSEC